MPTRRELVAGTAAALLAGAPEAAAQADEGGDGAVIARLVDVTQVTVFAYDQLGAKVDARLGAHAQAHVDRLAEALGRLNGTRPAPPAHAADVDRIAPGLGGATTREAAVAFALDLEAAGVAACHEAIRKLSVAELLQLTGSIMASKGQHLVLLRQAAGDDPVPNAVETGAG